MSQDGKDLQVILADQAKRELAPNVSSQVINEMKSSLIFQISWEQLLQAAPTAISSMGACFIASSSPKAVVQLDPPKDKAFLYLRYTSIQANLVECGNMGRMAFLEAEDKMGVIQLTSQVINGKINDIIPTIADPPSAKKMLRPQLQTLSRGAQTCLDASIAMDKKFTDWLLYVCEMHAACVQQESTTREALLSNEICMAAESTRLDYQKSAVDEAKKAQELLGKQVTTASEAFKKASDEFPTGWDIMGQQIVGDLAGAVTGALNAAIPALLNNLNPMAKLSAGANLVGGFLHPDKKDDTDNNNNNSAGGGAAVSAAQPPSPVPKKATDPGYAEIQKISAFLSTLQVIVAGQKDGDINWEMAKSGDSSKGGAKSAIKFVVTMLSDAKDRFAPLATSDEPSQTLIKILDVSLQVAKDLQAIVEKSSNMSTSYPAKDSAEVKKWQADFAAEYARANTLLATAKTIPGTAANGIPLMGNSADPTQQTAQITAKSAQAQAVLEAAKNRLATTTQMLTTAQDNYVKTTDMLLQQQNKLADIQATLTNLTACNISLAEIKRILIECIKLIIDLKDQITSLVRFFKAIGAIVDTCVKFHVEPFLDTIKAITAENDDPNKDYRVGDYTLTDLQRSQVYSAAVTLRSYFGVFGDIAKMWVTLSKENVVPGLKMCDELSVTANEKDPGDMAAKLKKLSQWSQEASGRVKTIAGNKQREIMDGMQSRIDDVAQTTQAISAPPASTLKAIEAGTEVTKEAAQKSIAQRAKTSALNRFGM
ncbi:hypothetical protein Focb16_v002486 [Fusarium oxysporum f. sp. cubense]|uniref:Uncharacterized protein n=1 Tax=Fusarium oxysporum f. sp. cubense TaxID=61366 RepID=A0A559L3V2_FUSOC|nr:hypothetical protein Focb16_v002486 [Fusarium oxysporum f. sp. cubense]